MGVSTGDGSLFRDATDLNMSVHLEDMGCRP